MEIPDRTANYLFIRGAPVKPFFPYLSCLILLISACAAPGFNTAPAAASPDSALPAAISSTPTASTGTSAGSSMPPEHLIGIRQSAGESEFYDLDSGEAFVPRGVNYVFVPGGDRYTNLLLKVGIYDPGQTRQDFQRLVEKGYNTVRVFLDHCSAGPGCIGAADNQGLNPAYLDNIADLLDAAKETGIFVLLTSNDLPDLGGYAEVANAGSGSDFAGYRNSYYLTPGAIRATRAYWSDLISGLVERSASTDHVLGWELLNEQWMFLDQPPLSLTSGSVTTTTGTYDMAREQDKQRMVSEGLIYYIKEVREEIILHDPTALVTMGFFAPELAAPDWYVETASLLEGSGLDFFDFHAYPGTHTLPEYAVRSAWRAIKRSPSSWVSMEPLSAFILT